MEKTINNHSDPEIIIKKEIKQPSLYKVVLYNDDITTMDFVVQILVDIFDKSIEDATTIMLSVHEKGLGVCGVYPKEIAEFRTNKTIFLARQSGFPLLCNMEKE